MNRKVPSKHKWTHRVAAGLIVRSIRFAARLSDRRMSQLLTSVEWLFQKANENHPALEAVRDIRDLFENSAEGNRALRAILLDGRPEQAYSMIRGLLRHYAGGAPLPFAALSQSLQDLHLSQPIRIGFYGENDESPWLKKEYEKNEFFDSIPIKGKRPSFEDIDAIEVASLDALTEGQIETIFSRKIPVSVSYSALNDPQTAQRIFSLADTSGAPLRILYSNHYYQPIRKAKELLDAGEIGEVTMVRLRATVAGKGGAASASITARTDVLSHPGFDHLPLLAYFGGRIEKAAAYINTMKAKQGGQALVTCKFAYPGRYGLLECTYAPGMYLRSNHLPYDLEGEIVGTDGTLWLSCGMSDRVQAAPIRVRIGRTSYTIGLETGLQHEWDHVYRNLVLEMAAMALKQTRPAVEKTELISALSAREAAKQSNKECKVIAV